MTGATRLLLLAAALPSLTLAADALRDPTLPPLRATPHTEAAAPAERPPLLRMIVRNGAARRALFDNGGFATVGVGDWIDAAGGRRQVLAIDDHGLWLARADGGRERIELLPAAGVVRRQPVKTPLDAATSSAARSGR